MPGFGQNEKISLQKALLFKLACFTASVDWTTYDHFTPLTDMSRLGAQHGVFGVSGVNPFQGPHDSAFREIQYANVVIQGPIETSLRICMDVFTHVALRIYHKILLYSSTNE